MTAPSPSSAPGVKKRTRASALVTGQRCWPRRWRGPGFVRTHWTCKGRNSEGEIVIAQGQKRQRLSTHVIVLTLVSDDSNLS